jgi:DNA-binding NarL/FixJ family response regulator
VRVIVADDLLLTREGIVHLLTDAGIDVVAQTGDAEGIVDLVDRERPDAVILDIRMPPTHTDEGLVAAGRVRNRDPRVGILILSHYTDSGWAMRLLEEHPEGVGYLLKDRVMDGAVIVDALRRVLDGETVIDPTIVSRLLGRRRRDDPLAALTSRERDVLSLVAEGMSNRGIAERLVLTERTVETHMSAILGKLGLEDSPGHHKRVLAVLQWLRG